MINKYIIIIGIIIFLLSLGISLYFILNHPKPTPIPVPPSPIPVPPSQCEGDLLPCGSGCYDKKTHACSIDNKICNLYQFNPLTKTCCNDNEQIYETTSLDSKGNKKIDGYVCCTPDNWAPQNNVCCPVKTCNGYCCTHTQWCNHDLDKNPCIDCPTKLCPDIDGGKCCDSSEQCYDGPTGATGINSQICSEPKLWDSNQRMCCDKTMPNCFPDENICTNTTCNAQQTCINKKTCCNNVYDSEEKVCSCISESGEDICCPTESSQFNKKCNKLESGKYLCCNDNHGFNKDTQLCGTICGNTTCNPNTQTAIFPPNSDCYCINKECEWGAYKYSPPLADNIIDVCSITDNLGTKYYTVKDPIGTDIDITKMSRTAETNESDTKNLCSTNDCIYKLSEKGMDINSYLDGKCEGHSDCDILLPSIKNSPDCPLKEKEACILDSNNKYTGRICMSSNGTLQKAYNGSNTLTSLDGSVLNSGDCICNNSIEDNCKNIDPNKFCPVPLNSDFKGILSLDTGKCSYIYNNNIYNNLNDLCAVFDTDDNTYGRCYKISDNNYKTDKICNRGETCLLENNQYICINNSEYCGQNGTWDNINKICNCVNGAVGSRCNYTRSGTCGGIGTPKFDGSCDYDWEYKASSDGCCIYAGQCDESHYTTPPVDPSDINQNQWKWQSRNSDCSCPQWCALGCAGKGVYTRQCVKGQTNCLNSNMYPC